MIVSENCVNYPEIGVVIILKEASRYRLLRQLELADLVIVASASDDCVFWVYKSRQVVLGESSRQLLDQIFEEYEITQDGIIRIGESDLVQLRLIASLG